MFKRLFWLIVGVACGAALVVFAQRVQYGHLRRLGRRLHCAGVDNRPVAIGVALCPTLLRDPCSMCADIDSLSATGGSEENDRLEIRWRVVKLEIFCIAAIEYQEHHAPGVRSRYREFELAFVRAIPIQGCDRIRWNRDCRGHPDLWCR